MAVTASKHSVNTKPDVTLMDLRLRDMSGIDALMDTF
jgi:CheY-like chemotaxis protein